MAASSKASMRVRWRRRTSGVLGFALVPLACAGAARPEGANTEQRACLAQCRFWARCASGITADACVPYCAPDEQARRDATPPHYTKGFSFEVTFGGRDWQVVREDFLDGYVDCLEHVGCMRKLITYDGCFERTRKAMQPSPVAREHCAAYAQRETACGRATTETACLELERRMAMRDDVLEQATRTCLSRGCEEMRACILRLTRGPSEAANVDH
jgi:hypothetical protein